MPVELGSFDAIIGMDWLAKYQAVIVCAEKIVRIPWGNETLIIHGDGKVEECRRRKNLRNSNVQDFPEFFMKNFQGLPQTLTKWSFKLIWFGAACSRAPYRLALLEMKELSEHWKELSDKGFI
ncbi:hypothetical protein Tco_0122224 [Tanacetum coccineum]